MLPDFGALDLRPREAPTGEFATLSREQADELNDSREVEPISLAEFEPSADLPPGSEYFRVRYKFQNKDHTYDYKYYDAGSLWQWVKTRRKLPHNREPIWREDWMDLRQRYDPGMAVPNAVMRLPSLADPIRVYEGTAGLQRHARTEFPSGQATYYDGPAGQERQIRHEWPNGEMRFYEGPRGQERKVRSTWSGGETHFFTGPQGQERKVRVEWASGQRRFFEGPMGQERKVRHEKPNGYVTYFDGPKGQERLVRTLFVSKDGTYLTEFFDGAKNQERRVARLTAKGADVRLKTFIGPQGAERKHVKFYHNGTDMDADFFEAVSGALRRQVYDNGEVRFYDGPIHVPRLRRVVTPEGEVRFYKGDEPNHETLVRVVTPEGEVITEFGPSTSDPF